MNMETKREYRMTSRAVAVEETGTRILDAAVEVFSESFDLPLREVAERAEVSEQTVIRRFGGKQSLLEAASRRESERIAAQRDEAPVGDTAGAVRVLLDHYDEHGEQVLRMLANEDRFDALGGILEGGRKLHEEWCARVFGPMLADLDPEVRARRLSQLIAATDVYTWKIFRRDRRMSRDQVELATCELIDAIAGDS